MKTVISLCCFATLLAVVTTACHGRRGIDLPTAPVSGKVTYQGRPLSFGRVTFFHPSGHAAGVDIAADGAFMLNAYQGSNGVSVECSEYQRPGSKAQRSRTGNDKSVIPVRYSAYATSGLTFEVKPGENSKAEFALKD